MLSSKVQDYDVEKVLSKRIDSKGRTFFLIKWKGYSTSENTWEPESHVTKCQDLIKEFEAQETEKKKSRNSNSKENHGRTSARLTRSSQLAPKESTNKNQRSTRSSNRSSLIHGHGKRSASQNDMLTDDEDENENDNGYSEKKSISIKRSRKSTTDTELTASIDSHDSDILDTDKLDQILDVRRNKKNNKVEYYIQVKKIKKPIWINSNRLTEDYNQQVVDFLEEKYV